MLEMSDIEVTKVLESDATEWQKKLFNLYNPYPLKISFQNQLIQNYGIGARDRFDQLVKEGKGMVSHRLWKMYKLGCLITVNYAVFFIHGQHCITKTLG